MPQVSDGTNNAIYLIKFYKNILKEVDDEKNNFLDAFFLCISLYNRFVYGCGGGAESGNPVDRL